MDPGQTMFLWLTKQEPSSSGSAFRPPVLLSMQQSKYSKHLYY